MDVNDLRAYLAQQDASASLEFVGSVIAPRYKVATPPGVAQRATYMQTLVANCNLKITSDAWNSEVSNQQGAVIWLTQRGCLSCFRCGKINAGTTILEADLVSASPNTNRYYEPFMGNIISMTFPTEVLIPYGQKGGQEQVITFSPDVDKNFSLARLVSGEMWINSATVKLDAGSITGRGSYGAVTDTRDVAVQSGKAFDPVIIATMSSITRDGLPSFPFYDQRGCTSIVGPDFSQKYTRPNADFTTAEDASLETVYVADSTQTVIMGGDVGIGSVGVLQNICVSQFGVTIVGDTPQTYSFATRPIDECGAQDFFVSFKPKVYSTNLFSNTARARTYQIGVACTSYFAYAVPGTQTYQTNVRFNSEQQIYWGQRFTIDSINTNTVLSPDLQSHLVTCRFKYSDVARSRTYFDQGKLVATVIQPILLYITPTYNTGATILDPTDPDLHCDITDFKIVISSPTVGTEGWTGPCHIMQYSELAEGQELVIGGKLNCQVIPNGNVAQYTQSAMEGTPRAININVLPLIARLFDNPTTRLQRMWTTKAYEDFIQSFGTDITAADLASLIAGKPDLMSAYAASGMHAGLGGDIAIQWPAMQRNASNTSSRAVSSTQAAFSALNNTPARILMRAGGQFGYDDTDQYQAKGEFGYHSAGKIVQDSSRCNPILAGLLGDTINEGRSAGMLPRSGTRLRQRED